MLTIKEVADALKINSMTVYRYLKAGKIKGIKVGYVWRIDQKELDRIIREGV